VENVATNPEHQEVLARMRKALGDWQRQYRDLGMIHEWQAAKMCADGKPLCEAAGTDRDYPLGRVLDTAGRVGISGQAAELVQRLSDADPTVRYWAAVGLRAAGREAASGQAALRKAMADLSMPVQIEAAGVLVAQWDDPAALDRLAAIISGPDELAADHAARTLEMLGEKARPVLPAMRKAAPQSGDPARRSLEAAIPKLSGEDKPPPSTPKGKGKKKRR